MYYKQAIITFIIFAIFIPIFAICIITIHDPYMLFHKNPLYKNSIYKNMRISDYRIINYEEFDAAIMGTSMMENTSAFEASTKLGHKFFNLSIEGASYYEKYTVLNYVMRKKNIKQIIMSLDFKFEKEQEQDNTFIGQIYKSDDHLEKYKFYLHSTPLKCALTGLCNFKAFNRDTPTEWHSSKENIQRFGGFEQWIKYEKESQQLQDVFHILKFETLHKNINLETAKRIIDTELLPLFEHSTTRFDLIIPPYSILWWKKLHAPEDVLKIYAYIIQQTAHNPHVRIYWFYDEDFPQKISFYKDLTHYHKSVNSLQIDAVKNATHMITLKNYEEKFDNWIKTLNTFDFSFIEKL